MAETLGGKDGHEVSLSVRPSSPASLLATGPLVAEIAFAEGVSPIVVESDILGLGEEAEEDLLPLGAPDVSVTVDAQLMAELGLELTPEASEAPVQEALTVQEANDDLDAVWDALMAVPQEAPPQPSAQWMPTAAHDRLEPLVESEEEEEEEDLPPPPLLPSQEAALQEPLRLTLTPTFEIADPELVPSDAPATPTPHVSDLVAAIEATQPEPDEPDPPDPPDPPPPPPTPVPDPRPIGVRRRGGPPTAVLLERMSVK